MFNLLKKILVPLLLASCLISSSLYAASTLETAVKESAYPLTTLSPSATNTDLLPLNNLFKNKKIIAIGEASHHSKEFFEARHRLFKYLVEEQGCRAFALELDFSVAADLNDYILGGEGTAQDVIRKKMDFWIYKTQEMADLLDWMRTYNKDKAPKDQIRFYGVDIQNEEASATFMYDYLLKVDSVSAAKLKPDFDKVVYGNTPTELLISLSDALTDLMNKNQATYIKNSSEADYFFALQTVENLKYFITYTTNQNGRMSFTIRGTSMANNAKWISNFEEKIYGHDKILLAAHNGHIMHHFPMRDMGNILKETYGDAYYSIGVDFYKGDLVAYDAYTSSQSPNIYSLSSSSKMHLSTQFEPLDESYIFFDVEQALKNPLLKPIFEKNQKMYMFGAVTSILYPISDVMSVNIPNNYDGVLYIESVHTPTSLIFDDYNQTIQLN